MPQFEFDFSKINMNLLVSLVGFIGTWAVLGFGVIQDIDQTKKDVAVHTKEIVQIKAVLEELSQSRTQVLISAAEMKAKLDNLTNIMIRVEQRQFELQKRTEVK